MAAVTVVRIARAYASLDDALTQTSRRSRLSEHEQDLLLADSCDQACDLLEDWLATERAKMRPSGDGPIAEYVPYQKHFGDFLGSTLKDILARASRPGMTVPDKLVDRASKAVKATTRRHHKMTPQQLSQVASAKVGALAKEVCGLADHLCDRLATQKQRAERRKKARKALRGVSAFLPVLVIAMAGVTPSQAAHNLTVWVEDIKVIAIHDIADRANPPGRRVEPTVLAPAERDTGPEVSQDTHSPEPPGTPPKGTSVSKPGIDGSSTGATPPRTATGLPPRPPSGSEAERRRAPRQPTDAELAEKAMKRWGRPRPPKGDSPFRHGKGRPGRGGTR